MQLPRFLRLDVAANRVYGLDILRAFAIVEVMIGHGGAFVPPVYVRFNNLLVFDGVSVFFVLSGFLIGGILVKTLARQKADAWTLLDFWVKRWFRTVPPYLLILIVVILFGLNDPGFNPALAKKYFVFLQNFKSGHPFFFMEAWSLSVEEWFYLLVPSAIFAGIALGIRAKHAVPLVAVGLLVLVTTYRYYKYLHLPPHDPVEWDQNYRKIVITRLDSLMYGVLAAYANYYAQATWTRHKKGQLFAGVCLLLLGNYTVPNTYGIYMCVFYFSLNSLAVMLMLPYLANLKTGAGVVYKTVTYISLISYSMYLLNLSIVSQRLVPLLTGRLLLAYPAFWAITLVLSVLMYKYFELPLMRLRSRFVTKMPAANLVAN